MTEILEIEKPEIILPFQNLPHEKEINIHTNSYRIIIDDISEFGMANYYFQTRILKNETIIFKDNLKLFGLDTLLSANNRFIFLPTSKQFKILDLFNDYNFIFLDKKDEDLFWSTYSLSQYDTLNKFLLLDKWEGGHKVIDLEKRKIIVNSNISNVHFGKDDLIWKMNQNESGFYLDRINFLSHVKSRSKIPSPYEYFNVKKSNIPNYNIEDDSNDNYNIYTENSSGLSHFSLLNNWKYYNNDSRNIYSTYIPTGKQQFSKNWNRMVFEAEEKYIQINP